MVLAITGGGAGAISRLLEVPGASGSVIEAIVPYHQNSLESFLGKTISQNCSPETARNLAMAAFQRAASCCGDENLTALLGVGCTAALSTRRLRRGANRAYVAIQSIGEIREYCLHFDKEKGDRQREETLTAEFILQCIGLACGKTDIEHTPVFDQEPVITQAPTAWQQLLDQEIVSTSSAGQGQPVFPGAFNPFHDGHRQMIQVAEAKLNAKVLLEISVANVDKFPLDFVDMQDHEQKLAGDYQLTFTNAPTFVEKSFLFPESTFIVGTDTIKRIGDSKYYGSPEKLDSALASMHQNKIQFLVFGRNTSSGYECLDDLDLPDKLGVLCTGISEKEFRNDISSTQLREQPYHKDIK